MELDADDREIIAIELYGSICPAGDEYKLSPAWREELERRWQAVLSGEEPTIELDEEMSQLFDDEID